MNTVLDRWASIQYEMQQAVKFSWRAQLRISKVSYYDVIFNAAVIR